MKQLLIMSLVILYALQLSGCMAPPDIPACRSLETREETKEVPDIGRVTLDRPNPTCIKEINEATCGYCVWTISDKKQYVGENKKTWLYGKPWSQVLRESVLLPAESYAEAKAFVINECKKTNDCNKDIDHWRVKLDSFSNKRGELWVEPGNKTTL